jgi:hypothetical protein
MEFPRLAIALLRLLLLIAHLWAVTHGVSASPNLSKDFERAVRLDRETTTQSSLSSTIEERRGLQLIKRWCSAYAQLNPARIAELQAPEVEIVDRFGGFHRLSARKEQERFWAAGFDIIQAGEFHPQCEALDVVFINSNTAVVHTKVSYPHGIRLKGGERIPPYSEIHTFVIAEREGPWLISGHSVTKQVLP